MKPDPNNPHSAGYAKRIKKLELKLDILRSSPSSLDIIAGQAQKIASLEAWGARLSQLIHDARNR